VLAFDSFPREHWLERVNKEIGRRSDVVGIYPRDKALIWLAGMLLIEQADEWLVQRRYLPEPRSRSCSPLSRPRPRKA
jgi:transposase-like protein